MLPLDYPLPVEYVYQAFPFMELTSHAIGLLLSAVLTITIVYVFNRFKNLKRLGIFNMTNNFPKLTELKVRYWYEELDPAWSGQDIANEIGCHKSTVYNFMQKKKIKIRDYSEADFNAQKCPHKHQAKHKMKTEMNSEWKINQRKAQLKNWENAPKKRKAKSDLMKKIALTRLSDYQTWVLFIIYCKNKEQTLKDIILITGLNKKIVNRQLYNLTNRKLLAVSKNKFNRYKITELGKKILPKEFKNKKYDLYHIRSELLTVRNLNKKRFIPHITNKNDPKIKIFMC